MKIIDKWLHQIPALLSSKISIFIYIFLFFYLVIWVFICFVIPPLNGLEPSTDTQLVLGNYTNILSALGASIAAGTGVAVHSGVKSMHKKHDEMQKTIDTLHEKIDELTSLVGNADDDSDSAQRPKPNTNNTIDKKKK